MTDWVDKVFSHKIWGDVTLSNFRKQFMYQSHWQIPDFFTPVILAKCIYKCEKILLSGGGPTLTSRNFIFCVKNLASSPHNNPLFPVRKTIQDFHNSRAHLAAPKTWFCQYLSKNNKSSRRKSFCKKLFRGVGLLFDENFPAFWRKNQRVANWRIFLLSFENYSDSQPNDENSRFEKRTLHSAKCRKKFLGVVVVGGRWRGTRLKKEGKSKHLPNPTPDFSFPLSGETERFPPPLSAWHCTQYW